jgi:8-oxo-dGTP pyrophosphatase MutT (NUDIX family)
MAVSARVTSCGVLVTDGERLLLGHASRSPRWDIPKGAAEPGEDFAEAAARELREETGLEVPASELSGLGLHAYLRGKDLALFAWAPAELPEPAGLSCSSFFTLPNGSRLPEFDRFGVFQWEEALSRVGKNLARILASISRTDLRRASK